MEVLWTFSIYLESVAILPQLFMVSKTGEAESITSHYLFALGSYRALYIVNWIYRYYAESKFPTWTPFKICKFDFYLINFILIYWQLVLNYDHSFIFRFLWYHCYCCWMCTNDPLLRLLLSLHNKSFKRKEASASCLKHMLLLEYHNQIYQETLSVPKAHHIK